MPNGKKKQSVREEAAFWPLEFPNLSYAGDKNWVVFTSRSPCGDFVTEWFLREVLVPRIQRARQECWGAPGVNENPDSHWASLSMDGSSSNINFIRNQEAMLRQNRIHVSLPPGSCTDWNQTEDVAPCFRTLKTKERKTRCPFTKLDVDPYLPSIMKKA